MTDLAGRVALVTGAGRRVGRAIAVALGARTMNVIVHYNGSEAGARETVRMIEAAGGSASMRRADLGSIDACERLIDDVGAMDALINSAAMMLRTPIGQVTATEWEDMNALNVRAPFFLTQRAAPALKTSKGCVVNIADMAAFETWTGYVPHGMTKAAVVQMTRAMAHALAPDIRVNGVAPGVVMLPDEFDEKGAEHLRRTTPLQRFGTADDVAQAVVYLLQADFVTGEIIRVDGGRHVRR
ncbi:MAG: short-chain dehydrogenase/reductase [Gemmatimonadetes bacterium]|nr:short-chain dehydrogenase/reductase [Gemmatimonadota bacterium]